nr:NTP transferase domain-containing protein [Sphingorhabdus sp.]
MNHIAAIILAAGKGTRMKSGIHKVLHKIAGRSMLMHLMDSVDALEPAAKVVVVGSGKEQLEAALAGSAILAVQEPQYGTGHAVQMAEGALANFTADHPGGDVLILYGDVPFVPTATMAAMVDRLNQGDNPAVVVLAFEAEDPTGYGRVITENGRIVKMVEQKDASDAEKLVKLSNSGLMAVKARDLFALLARVTDDNAQKEFYLTDIVNIANGDGRVCVFVTTDPFDVTGINSRAQLAEMERDWQNRRRRQAMDDGATLIAPETVWFAYDTVVGRDVVIEPGVFFGPGVTIADNVWI